MIWKSLLVGLVYSMALVIGGLVVELVGLTLSEAKDTPMTLLWSFIGGTIAGLFLGPVAESMPATPKRHFIILAS